MKSELKMVKEFRRKRAQMQKELDEVMSQFIFLCQLDSHFTQKCMTLENRSSLL